MLVAEEVDSRFATAVVEPTFNKYTKHGTLARIDIADHRYPCFDDVVHALRPLPQDHLATHTRLFGVSRPHLSVTAHVARHEDLEVGLDLFTGNSYPLQSELPILFREPHGFATVLYSDIEKRLAMALCQALLDMPNKRWDILLSGVCKQRPQADMRAVIVGEAELI